MEDDEFVQQARRDAAKQDEQDKQDYVQHMKTKDFLIGRTKETIQVPVSGLGGSKNIEIRARLSKREMRQHKLVFDKFATASRRELAQIETAEDERAVAEFLAAITTDPELDTAFWLQEDLAPEVADELLMAYFVAEPTRRMVEIGKFLAERVGSAPGRTAEKLAPDPASVRQS